MAITPIKMMGAYTLTDESSATSASLYSLDKIPTGVMSVKDMVFTQQDNALYVHVGIDEGYDIPEEEPYYIQPNDETGYKRWKLMDLHANSVVSNLMTSHSGSAMTLSALDSGGSVVGSIVIDPVSGDVTVTDNLNVSGALNLTSLTTESTSLVNNLNAEFLGGQPSGAYILSDGSIPFSAAVSGVAGTFPESLVTKFQLDNLTDGTSGMIFQDGSIAFTAPVSGVTPTLPPHLTTKEYVDANMSGDLAWTTVSDATELEQAITDGELRIYMLDGTYELTGKIFAYSGLILKGESKEGVILHLTGDEAIYISPNPTSYIDQTTTLINHGDYVINIQALGTDYDAGSMAIFDGYPYTLALSAASTDTTLTLTEPIYQDTDDFYPVSATDIRMYRAEDIVKNVIFDTFSIDHSDLGGTYGFRLEGFRNVVLNDIEFVGADHTSSTNIIVNRGQQLLFNNISVYSQIYIQEVSHVTFNNWQRNPLGNTLGGGDNAVSTLMYMTTCQNVNINSMEGHGRVWIWGLHNSKLENIHVNSDNQYDLLNLKRSTVTNCYTHSSSDGEAFNIGTNTQNSQASVSKWFTITGCNAPDHATPITVTGVSPSGYAIHNNHWQSGDFSPTVTAPTTGEFLGWDGDEWVNTNDVEHINFYSHDETNGHVEPGQVHYHAHSNGEEQWLTVYNDDIGIDLGGQCVIPVRNETGATIGKGLICAAISGSGGIPYIELASASAANATKVIGWSAMEIPNNTNGWVVGQGHLYEIDLGLTSYPDLFDGCCLYLSPSAGKVTAVAPEPPLYNVRVGLATNVHDTEGKVCIRIGVTPLFGDIMGLPASAFADGQLAVWNNTSERWDASLTLTGDYVFSGLTSGIYLNELEDGYTDYSSLHNIGIGSNSLPDTTTATNHLAIGEGALQNMAGNADGNVAIGISALESASTNDVNYNYALGYYSLQSLTVGDSNTAIGAYSMTVADGASENVGLGESSLGGLSTGGQNTGIGMNTLGNVTTGVGNVGLGYYAGTDAGNVSGSLFISNGTNASNDWITGDSSYNVSIPNGGLYVSGNVSASIPTLNNHLATKAYVDAGASETWSVNNLPASGWTEIFIDGVADSRLVVNNGEGVHFEMFVTITDDWLKSYNAYKINGFIKTSGAVCSMVNSNVTVVAEEDSGLNVRVVANDTYNSLSVEVYSDDASKTEYVTAHLTYRLDVAQS